MSKKIGMILNGTSKES